VGRVAVSAFLRAGERLLGVGKLFVLRQEHAQLERPVSIATLISPEVRLRGAGDVAPVLEERAQLRRGARVAATVRAF
jgi:hypothetical protein